MMDTETREVLAEVSRIIVESNERMLARLIALGEQQNRTLERIVALEERQITTQNDQSALLIAMAKKLAER
jgi:hypothetical protein